MVCLALAGSAFAQGGGTATLTGTVVDNVGVVPGATVTVTNTANAAERTVTSNEQGVFRIPSLAPGRYTVKVNMQGFKQIDVPDLPILSG
jgi:hypothetical protein